MLNGEYVVVEQVQHELIEKPVAVYNFEVEDFHTYYVGNISVLVHNLCINQTNTSGTGQKHHPFSKKIVEAANEHDNLRGFIKRDVGTVKALTPDGYRGYQDWHRKLDETIVNWIRNIKQATLDDFVKQMNVWYGNSTITEIFGIITFG